MIKINPFRGSQAVVLKKTQTHTKIMYCSVLQCDAVCGRLLQQNQHHITIGALCADTPTRQSHTQKTNGPEKQNTPITSRASPSMKIATMKFGGKEPSI